MTLHEIIKKSGKMMGDNSPAILTALGVTGTVATAYLTGKASIRAHQLMLEEDANRVAEARRTESPTPPVLTNMEIFKLSWQEYIPAAGTGLITITCIIFANRIGTRRAAAMAAAYSISEKAFTEYREKIVEKLGENKERAARDEIAQDRVAASPVGKNEVIITGGGEVLCYDMYTGRYFQSSMETLKKAQNDVNYKILNDYYASLSDFYDRIGLSRTKTSDEVGWNVDKQLELLFSTTMSDDNRPCIAIDFRVEPIRNYFRIH